MLPVLARSACARTGLAPAAALLRPLPVQRRHLTRPSAAASSSSSVSPNLTRPRRFLSTTRTLFKPPTTASSTPASITPPPAAPVTAASTTVVDTAPPAPGIIDRYLPRWAEPARPYLYLLRLDKPIGTLLLYWPCAWAITLASSAVAAPIATCAWYLALFGTGALVMRGAGCIVNDMWDARMDAMVERTKTRPIAAGDVTQFNALVFLGSQLLLGLAILTQLNTYSIILGACSLPFVVIYPFMKRITYHPQIVFGLTFNWGAMLGWSAVAGVVDWSVCAPLYLGGVLWGIGYDTIYAHQDKLDDVIAGVKSTALAWGDQSKPFIGTLYAAFVGLLTVAGHAAGVGPLYYAISCVGSAIHLAWQVIKVDLDSRADCWRMFKSNGYVTGPIIWLGCAADYLYNMFMPLIG